MLKEKIVDLKNTEPDIVVLPYDGTLIKSNENGYYEEKRIFRYDVIIQSNNLSKPMRIAVRKRRDFTSETCYSLEENRKMVEECLDEIDAIFQVYDLADKFSSNVEDILFKAAESAEDELSYCGGMEILWDYDKIEKEDDDEV